jgi:uroporphyrinogen decarboxylase
LANFTRQTRSPTDAVRGWKSYSRPFPPRLWTAVSWGNLESARFAAYSEAIIRHHPHTHRANIIFIISKESFLKVGGKSLLSVLNGETVWPPPRWLMRQAGRYLPEYRELRGRAGSFWKMCMDSALAAEVTLQPIRRFGFDAAIIFSDILTVPYALGRTVRFTEGEGPSLEPVSSVSELDDDQDAWRSKLDPAYETLRLVRRQLPAETALLGFAGAPWTLATYMAAGRGGDEQRAAKLWGYREPESFAALLELIGDCVAQHLIAQIEAGADAVQIFDSWAGGLPERAFDNWVVAPTKRIVEKIRIAQPQARIIGFPRAAALHGYLRYAQETGVDAVSLDTSVPLSWAVENIPDNIAAQGNLDPIALVAGGEALAQQVDDILNAARRRPFIFNLGHGVLPQTPLEHVAALVEQVRSAR